MNNLRRYLCKIQNSSLSELNSVIKHLKTPVSLSLLIVASTELWNSQALSQCKMAPPVITGTQCRVPYTWGLGFGLVSQVLSLGDALGEVGKKSLFRELKLYNEFHNDSNNETRTTQMMQK